MHEPKLTAYDDTSRRCWRIDRLLMVAGYVQALADHYGNEGLLFRVAALNDHKGILEVSWYKEPTQGEKELFAKAWESSIATEDKAAVTHEVKKKEDEGLPWPENG